MAPKDPTSRKRRRYGWHEPRWSDPAFWAAVGLTVALVVAQAFLVGERGTTFWYASMAVRVLFTWILISAVIRIRVGIQRGLVGGFRESQERAEAKPTGSTADNLARTSGRTVGRAIAAYKKSQSSSSD